MSQENPSPEAKEARQSNAILVERVDQMVHNFQTVVTTLKDELQQMRRLLQSNVRQNIQFNPEYDLSHNIDMVEGELLLRKTLYFLVPLNMRCCKRRKQPFCKRRREQDSHNIVRMWHFIATRWQQARKLQSQKKSAERKGCDPV